MNRETLDRIFEKGILALVLGILVYGPLAFGAVEIRHFIVLECLTIGVVALWVFRLWLGANPRLLWTPVCWAVLAFAVYACFRYYTADIEFVARQELIRVLLYAVLFLAIHNNLYGQDNLRMMVLVLVFLAMCISGYALYQYFTDSDRVWTYFKPYKNRASGTYISPNHLGGFLEMILPLALACTLLARFKTLTKVFIGYAALVILAGISVTFSRGSWFSTILAVSFFLGVLLFRRRLRLPAVLMLAVILAGAAILIPKDIAFRQRFQQMTTADQENRVNSGMRFEMWRSAVEMWKENVLWGVGPAHFDYRFRTYRPASIQLRPDRVHNDYLNTLVDWGIVGALLAGLVVTFVIAGAIRTWKRVGSKFSDLGEQTNSTKAALVLGAGAGFLAILFHSTLDFNLHIPANALTAVFLVSILSIHMRFASDDFWSRKRLWMQVLVTLALAAFVVFIAREVPKQYASSQARRLAARQPLYSPAQVKYLEQAFRADPANSELAYAIGEAYRIQSLAGGADYAELGQKALDWYAIGAKLNPWDGYAYLRQGQVLDWLDREAESGGFFSRAEALDPNGYFTVAHIGIHYVEVGDYAAARTWFERSLRLKWEKNPIAQNYLSICNQKLAEAAQPLNIGLPAVENDGK